jgi:hypothetical protein
MNDQPRHRRTDHWGHQQRVTEMAVHFQRKQRITRGAQENIEIRKFTREKSHYRRRSDTLARHHANRDRYAQESVR